MYLGRGEREGKEREKGKGKKKSYLFFFFFFPKWFLLKDNDERKKREAWGEDLNFLQSPVIPQSSTLGPHKGELRIYTMSTTSRALETSMLAVPERWLSEMRQEPSFHSLQHPRPVLSYRSADLASTQGGNRSVLRHTKKLERQQNSFWNPQRSQDATSQAIMLM